MFFILTARELLVKRKDLPVPTLAGPTRLYQGTVKQINMGIFTLVNQIDHSRREFQLHGKEGHIKLQLGQGHSPVY